MNDQVLVVKMNTLVSGDKMQKIYESILSQVEKGVVLLPVGCEAIVVPKDIEIRVEAKEE